MEEETYVPGEMVEEEQEAKSAQPVYPAPFGYKFGNSSVDLSIEDNHTTMKDEYEAWWNQKETKETKHRKSLIRNTLVCLLKKLDRTSVKCYRC
ncbi:MAG: hypothetical protein CM15mV84_250 [uncultured marine virus]|nr:MAG: hypothetical protein CM15mV84_250 [uncultured marine virus]